MSEAISGETQVPIEERDLYFEQWIYARSPLGTLATSAVIYLLLVGTFALALMASHGPLIAFQGDALVLPQQTRAALILSLLIVTPLGMQRYARIKDQEDVARNPESCWRGAAAVADYAAMTPSGARLLTATAFGIVIGLLVGYVTNPHLTLQFWSMPPVGWWFFAASTFLCVLFARGVELTRAGGSAWRTFIEKELAIDLLRIDRLSLVGRSAARTALIWFSVSAVACLFLVGGVDTGFVVALLLACAAMGIGIFVLTMEKVHRRILDTKRTELERIRSQIDMIRVDAHASGDASQRLQGLIAYETRIAGAPEWPFDQTTAARVGASALILTVPWFGQALAGTLVERLGHLVH